MKAFFAAALMALAVSGCRGYPDMETERYTVERTWSAPVAEVNNCRQTKRNSYCWVRVEGGQWVERSMRNWPGGTIQEGDRLGTLYRVGDDWVETWLLRSSSDKMLWNGFCRKSDPKCTWPSKPKG